MSLTNEQARFLALHARELDPPMRWQWIFQGGALRAWTDRHSEVATISARGFDHLVSAGLLERLGVAGARITDAGRAAICGA